MIQMNEPFVFLSLLYFLRYLDVLAKRQADAVKVHPFLHHGCFAITCFEFEIQH
jgi:hypothetical protein